MARFHDWLLSDAPGAAHAFAGIIIGGTFVGIVLTALGIVTLYETVPAWLGHLAYALSIR